MANNNLYKMSSSDILRKLCPREQKSPFGSFVNFSYENNHTRTQGFGIFKPVTRVTNFTVPKYMIFERINGEYFEILTGLPIVSTKNYKIGNGIYYREYDNDGILLFPTKPVDMAEAGRCYDGFSTAQLAKVKTKYEKFAKEALAAKQYYDQIQLQKEQQEQLNNTEASEKMKTLLKRYK